MIFSLSMNSIVDTYFIYTPLFIIPKLPLNWLELLDWANIFSTISLPNYGLKYQAQITWYRYLKLTVEF